MPLDIRPDHLQLVLGILNTHIPGYQVFAFGSRVKGSAKTTSDLDLCIKGNDHTSLEVLANIRYDFSESNLPYKVDVVDWFAIEPGFRDVITDSQVVKLKI